LHGTTVDKQAGGGNINSQASDSPCHVIDLDASESVNYIATPEL